MSVWKITDGSVDMHVVAVQEEDVYDMASVREYFAEVEHGIFAERVEDYTPITVDFEGVKVKHMAEVWALIYGAHSPTLLCQSEY